MQAMKQHQQAGVHAIHSNSGPYSQRIGARQQKQVFLLRCPMPSQKGRNAPYLQDTMHSCSFSQRWHTICSLAPMQIPLSHGASVSALLA